MTKRTKAAMKPEDQVKAFRKAARELGADPDEGRFQDALRTIAKAKPSPEKRKDRARAGRRD
jgi:hypothetical protein